MEATLCRTRGIFCKLEERCNYTLHYKHSLQSGVTHSNPITSVIFIMYFQLGITFIRQKDRLHPGSKCTEIGSNSSLFLQLSHSHHKVDAEYEILQLDGKGEQTNISSIYLFIYDFYCLRDKLLNCSLPSLEHALPILLLIFLFSSIV